ncbi:MAG: Vgb family protein [Gaiellales bacterium]
MAIGFAMAALAAVCSGLAATASAAGSLQEIPVKAGAAPHDLALSNTGNAIQFAETGTGTLGNISERNRYTRYALPLVHGQPTGIALSAQGDLWITEAAAGVLERWRAGKVKVFTLPRGSQPRGIAAGTQAVWFCEAGTNRIGRMTPKGFFTQYSIPAAHADPARIAIGQDGQVWFTEQAADRVGRVNGSTGKITQITLAAGSHPFGIAPGPDGNMWVTEPGLGRVAVLSPSTGEVVAEYPAGTKPLGITTGTDGLVWVTDPGSNSVVSLTSGGVATSYPVPTANAGVFGIANGPRGQIWFSEQRASRIGHIDNTVPHTQSVSVGAKIVEQSPPRLALGATVQWTFFGPGMQSATDATGMGLYDSGPQSFVTRFSHVFDAAGDYPFRSTTSALGGVVKVMLRVSASSVAVNSPVTVTFATGAAQPGFHYEVQVKLPGHGSFTPWFSGVQPSGNYRPAHAGVYQFQARLVDTATSPQTSSGWSPSVPVTAH